MTLSVQFQVGGEKITEKGYTSLGSGTTYFIGPYELHFPRPDFREATEGDGPLWKYNIQESILDG